MGSIVGRAYCRGHIIIVVLQVLLQYSREMGLDVGQVGYQAVATSCQKEQDGMQLLEKIKVQYYYPHTR